MNDIAWPRLFARMRIARPEARVRPSMSANERMIFAKRLALMLRAGLPILSALCMIRDESRSRGARSLCASLMESVECGVPLAQSLEKYPRVFDAYAIGIVRVGEMSGNLHVNLEYLAEEMKRARALRRKVVGALIYPAILSVSTVAISLVMTLFIFPKIVPIFQSIRMQLPWSTRALMTISSFLMRRGWLLLMGAAALIIALRSARARSERCREATDAALLRAPLIGGMLRDFHIVTICRTLSLLIKSEVEITASLDMIAQAAGDRVYRRELIAIRDALSRGLTISSYIVDKPRLFPPLMAQLVSVGETTGELADMLSYVAAHHEEEIDASARNLTTLLEPVLMLVMGIIVGFIAISIILPIYGMTQGLSPKGV